MGLCVISRLLHVFLRSRDRQNYVELGKAKATNLVQRFHFGVLVRFLVIFVLEDLVIIIF